jgi:Domain of unknown function (DUF4401)
MTPSPDLAVWSQLQAARIVAGDAFPVGSVPSPWYVRAMLGIAGWIAASFALGFVGAGFAFIIESQTASVITGLAIIGGAYAVFRTLGRNDFGSQFGLAASFSGQALVMYGILSRPGSTREGWFLVAAIEATLAMLVPNFTHRVWCAFMAAVAVAIALLGSGGYFLSAGLIAAGAAGIWLNEFAWATRGSLIRPIGYGLTLALLTVQATFFSRPMLIDLLSLRISRDWAPLWTGAVLSTIVLCVVVWRLLERPREAVSPTTALVALGGALAIGTMSLKAPGIATGLMIVVLGHANGSRTLLGLGIFALLGYISAYYYLLDWTLLAKSEAFAVVGIVVLALRMACSRWFLPGARVEEPRHA